MQRSFQSSIRKACYFIRQKSNCSYTDNCLIQIIPFSVEPPKLLGNSGHYTTRDRKPIMYPSAYSRVGWSNMIYVPSSRHIKVGEFYLIIVALIYHLQSKTSKTTIEIFQEIDSCMARIHLENICTDSQSG